MKRLITAPLAILLISNLLSSCESHDGESYFKAKCEVEFLGTTYIDQTPLTNIFSPSAPVTPYFVIQEWTDGKKWLEFHSSQRVARQGETAFFVNLQFAVDDANRLQGRTFTIDYDESFDEASGGYYPLHCLNSRINFGSIADRQVLTGTFTISGVDNNGDYSGAFECTTSEGTFKGTFSSTSL